MSVYIVGYDLNRPRGASAYPELIKALKEDFTNWWHYLDSTWVIVTNLSAAQVRDKLQQHIDSGDELLVARLSGESAWTGFDKTASDWLKTNLGKLVASY